MCSIRSKGMQLETKKTNMFDCWPETDHIKEAGAFSHQSDCAIYLS